MRAIYQQNNNWSSSSDPTIYGTAGNEKQFLRHTVGNQASSEPQQGAPPKKDDRRPMHFPPEQPREGNKYSVLDAKSRATVQVQSIHPSAMPNCGTSLLAAQTGMYVPFPPQQLQQYTQMLSSLLGPAYFEQLKQHVEKGAHSVLGLHQITNCEDDQLFSNPNNPSTRPTPSLFFTNANSSTTDSSAFHECGTQTLGGSHSLSEDFDHSSIPNPEDKPLRPAWSRMDQDIDSFCQQNLPGRQGPAFDDASATAGVAAKSRDYHSHIAIPHASTASAASVLGRAFIRGPPTTEAISIGQGLAHQTHVINHGLVTTAVGVVPMLAEETPTDPRSAFTPLHPPPCDSSSWGAYSSPHLSLGAAPPGIISPVLESNARLTGNAPSTAASLDEQFMNMSLLSPSPAAPSPRPPESTRPPDWLLWNHGSSLSGESFLDDSFPSLKNDPSPTRLYPTTTTTTTTTQVVPAAAAPVSEKRLDQGPRVVEAPACWENDPLPAEELFYFLQDVDLSEES